MSSPEGSAQVEPTSGGNRRRLFQAAGGFLIIVGLVLAVAPWVSVWRGSSEALDQLPVGEGRQDDDPNGLAMFDDDFVIATRTYAATSVSQLETALTADGFRPSSLRGQTWYTKECCGGWDATAVRVTDTPDGAEATVSFADNDVQTAWPIAGLVGAALALGGVAVTRSSRPPKSTLDSGRIRHTTQLRF